MSPRHRLLRGAALLALLACVSGLLVAAGDAPAPGKGDKRPAQKTAPRAAATSRPYKTETVRGKIVWLNEALERSFGVATDPESAETAVALQLPGGDLLPIIPDTRGRAFMVDSRLRGIELELLVRRHQGVPMIQVIRVFRPQADGLYEIDYWCDTCAISMFILKPCDCCQGETRLRQQLVEKGASPSKP
jgi:hypothetical protein